MFLFYIHKKYEVMWDWLLCKSKLYETEVNVKRKKLVNLVTLYSCSTLTLPLSFIFLSQVY